MWPRQATLKRRACFGARKASRTGLVIVGPLAQTAAPPDHQGNRHERRQVMMRACLETVIALNNQAAASGSASVEEALSTSSLPLLSQAITLLRSTAREVEDGENKSSHSTNSRGADTNSYDSCTVEVGVCSEISDILYKAAPHAVNDEGFFIFLRPLTLAFDKESAVATPEDEGWESALSLTSTVLLFNMAVTWHAIGIQHAGMRTAAFTKASHLYDMLLRFLAGSDCDALQDEEGRNDYHLWNILQCLVLNNRASLYYEHADYGRYQECLNVMKAALVDTVAEAASDDAMPDVDSGSILHPTEMHDLLENVLLWYTRLPSVAVAA